MNPHSELSILKEIWDKVTLTLLSFPYLVKRFFLGFFWKVKSERGIIKGFNLGNGCFRFRQFSHLLFADDLIIFVKDTQDNANKVSVGIFD